MQARAVDTIADQNNGTNCRTRVFREFEPTLEKEQVFMQSAKNGQLGNAKAATEKSWICPRRGDEL